ncbi:MAG: pantoate--beta-alanine ligase [Saccharofermentanales bacterium]
MINISKIKETREIIKEWKKKGFTVGFVPTMGHLHDGHKSLITKARKENDKVVVSIFVNPIQFGPDEDYEKYPRNMERDLEICSDAGADLVFAPLAIEMYASNNLVYIDVDELGDGLCGSMRSGHFRGVCTVVAKLFNMVIPDKAYFGEKDAQQLVIIKRMVQDLNFDLEIIQCPIIRELDGLAMSSRNIYLSAQERQAALVISRSLDLAKQALYQGERNAKVIRKLITKKIQTEPLASINYVEVVDAETLRSVSEISEPVLVAIAVYINKTRLIDNFTFKESLNDY